MEQTEVKTLEDALKFISYHFDVAVDKVRMEFVKFFKLMRSRTPPFSLEVTVSINPQSDDNTQKTVIVRGTRYPMEVSSVNYRGLDPETREMREMTTILFRTLWHLKEPTTRLSPRRNSTGHKITNRN